jgi:hypothetical protein
LCLGIYGALNFARFGNPFESGYSYLVDNGFFQVRNTEHGRISPAYVPVNLYYLLLHGVNLIWDPATAYLSNVQVDLFGTGLLAASPFFLVAFYQRLPRPLDVGLIVGVLLILATQLLYQSNGSAQINTQRYALDAWPFIIVLVASGLQARAEKGEARLWLALIVYAIGLNVWMLMLIEPFNRFLERWLTWF